MHDRKYEYDVELTSDPIVNTVIEKLISRSARGMQTYGVPMTRTDLSTLDWINHAQEEALDFACYLERLKKDIEQN